MTISVSDLDQFVADLSGRGVTAGPTEAVGEVARKSVTVDEDGNAISWIEVGSAK